MFENVDGRTDNGVIGILIAHLGAFGSGELKIMKNYPACKELTSVCILIYNFQGPSSKTF